MFYSKLTSYIKLNLSKKFTLLSRFLIILCAYTLLVACDPLLESKNSHSVAITIDKAIKFQTIRNFGASDAWSCQFVGSWPEEKKSQMAEWLFSTQMDSLGNPKGIGLTSWRTNIGAGSTEQGAASEIADEWRRAPIAYQGTALDSSKVNGQQWFLEAANRYKVQDLIAFANSPPVQMTKNGKAFSKGGNSTNLRADSYKQFSNYLINFLLKQQNLGIEIDYISPFNEPQWAWTEGNQEGTPWLNSEIHHLTKILDKELSGYKLATKIELPEVAELTYLYKTDSARMKRGRQIAAFFNPKNNLFVGDLASLSKKISGHSYYTTWPISKRNEVRNHLSKELANYPELEFWMTEYCILEKNERIKGRGKDLGMDAAIYMAEVIWADLVIANASAWQWWLAISPYDYKDGLIYIDKQKSNGSFIDAKLLWGLGNFSRFVRPGMIRIQSKTSQETSGLLNVSFADPKTGLITIVLINTSVKQKEVTLPTIKGNLHWYITSDNQKMEFMEQITPGEFISVPPRSISTFTEVL
jgi:O-glycosyl hydrolase